MPEPVKDTETKIKEEETKVNEQVDAAGNAAKRDAEAKGASPDEVKEVVEKARKEEKDKLYPQIEELKTAMKDIQNTLKAEREDKEKIKREADQKAEQERQAKLSDQEKTTEILSRLEEQLKNEQRQREKLTKQLEEKERKSELDRYRTKLIDDNQNEIIPELVSGNTVEELDRSLEIAKTRFKELAERFQQTRSDETRRALGRSSTNPDYMDALEEHELSKDLTALDQDKYLKDPDYRRQIQDQLEMEYARAAGRR